jgi:hypothetical protein
VHRKQFVVGRSLDEVSLRSQEFEADDGGECPADKEEEGYRNQIEQRDTFGMRPANWRVSVTG